MKFLEISIALDKFAYRLKTLFLMNNFRVLLNNI